MYENVTAEEMLSTIDNGWHPVWFAVENSALKVDLCVNYRLNDGKAIFLQFYSTDINKLNQLAHEVARKAKENWSSTLDKMMGNLEEQLDEAAETEKIIASIQWTENQQYRITYNNDDEQKYIYECVFVSDNEIYLKKVVDENDIWYRYNRPDEQDVREIILPGVKIEILN
jgi:hypothetical protein